MTGSPKYSRLTLAAGIATLIAVVMLVVSFIIADGLHETSTMTEAIRYILAVLLPLGLGTAARISSNRAGRKPRGRWIANLAILIALFMLVWGLPVLGMQEHDLSGARTAACQNNLKELMWAMLSYAQDHNDTLPDASRWCDELQPYLNNRQVFVCPRTTGQRCSYAFNAALSKVKLSSLEDQHIIALFESDKGWNGSGGLSAIASPARHRSGSPVAFSDGFVKWVRDARMKDQQWQPKPKEQTNGT